MSKPPQLADRFEVAASLGASLLAMARDRDIDVDSIARSMGLNTSSFNDFSTRISLDRLCRLFESLAIISGDPAFGLKAADYLEPGSTGIYGYGMLSAPTLAESLSFAVRHHRLLMETQHCAIVVKGEIAQLEWSLPALIVRHDQFTDYFAALFAARYRGLLGLNLRAARFLLQRPPPAALGLYRRKLATNLRFGEPMNAIEFPASLMATPNPKADARLHRLMEEQCNKQAELKVENDDLQTRIRLFLLQNLSAGEPTLEHVARHMGMSERTLQRRLAEAGTSHNDLIDQTRCEWARRLLRDSERSISDIGYELGFSQPSAFTRSTRRWFGRSPSELRRELRSPSRH
jgi:AraC-like DNA-binding protein